MVVFLLDIDCAPTKACQEIFPGQWTTLKAAGHSIWPIHPLACAITSQNCSKASLSLGCTTGTVKRWYKHSFRYQLPVTQWSCLHSRMSALFHAMTRLWHLRCFGLSIGKNSEIWTTGCWLKRSQISSTLSAMLIQNTSQSSKLLPKPQHRLTHRPNLVHCCVANPRTILQNGHCLQRRWSPESVENWWVWVLDRGFMLNVLVDRGE